MTPIKKVKFSSPVTGGERCVTIATSWSGGGAHPGDGKLFFVWHYYYSDEITPEVRGMLLDAIDRLAEERSMEVYSRRLGGFDLQELQSMYTARPEPGKTAYTGWGPLNERLH